MFAVVVCLFLLLMCVFVVSCVFVCWMLCVLLLYVAVFVVFVFVVVLCALLFWDD